MTKLIWRPYRPGDELGIVSNRWVSATPGGMIGLRRKLAEQPPYTFSVVDPDGRCWAVMGISPIHETNGEVWSVIEDEGRGLMALPRTVRDAMHFCQWYYGFVRLFATCAPREKDELGHWFEFLGMTYETVLDGWGRDGGERLFYSRVVR